MRSCRRSPTFPKSTMPSATLAKQLSTADEDKLFCLIINFRLGRGKVRREKAVRMFLVIRINYTSDTYTANRLWMFKISHRASKLYMKFALDAVTKIIFFLSLRSLALMNSEK